MINLEEALFNPASVFKTPNDVLNEKTLSKEDKIAILQHWSDDERELLVAEEENMQPSKHEKASVLPEIQAALEALGVKHGDRSSDTKHG